MKDGRIFKKICPFHKNRAVNLHKFMKNRPERLISFLVVWLTMFSCIYSRGQNSYAQLLKVDFLQLKYPGSPELLIRWNLSFQAKNQAGLLRVSDCCGFMEKKNELLFDEDPVYVQPANLYYIQSGFFCKREWELEKATHIPFRFRLGSLADCNAMEGKH
jgi:hypothetical protein